jgi:transposase-like protein
MAAKMSGGNKRRAAAELAVEYGTGGSSFVAKEFGMSRNTIRKGIEEIKSGENIEDEFYMRGRLRATEKQPELESQIREILDGQSQADPQFKTNRLYTKLSIKEIRKQMIQQYGYAESDLPTERTLDTVINEMGYTVRSVEKTKPKKVIEETNEIFNALEELHSEAAEDGNTVRLSIDTKDKVKIGEFSRKGKTRVKTQAYDHDFGDETVLPFGIMNVKEKNVDIYLSDSKVTADFMVDALDDYWIRNGYSGSGKKLLLNADNGPENNSHRTEFIKRLVEFSIEHNTEIMLAYYPPYHSKYNPVERVWGVLEQHWNGALLDTKETVENYINTMTYDGRHPNVQFVDRVYETGIKVGKKAMVIYEKALDRLAGLEKWIVKISPQKCMDTLAFTDCFI